VDSLYSTQLVYTVFALLAASQSRAMIKLRNIGSSEWELWKEQRLAALKEAPYAFHSKLAEWENMPEQRWRARLSILNACQLLAFLDGKAVGMVGGFLADEPEVVELVSFVGSSRSTRPWSRACTDSCC
jgi:hypothetical protein